MEMGRTLAGQDDRVGIGDIDLLASRPPIPAVLRQPVVFLRRSVFLEATISSTHLHLQLAKSGTAPAPTGF
jgi:hypothetical protein